MPHWLRKSLVILISVVTFGLITPQELFNHFGDSNKEEKRNLVEAYTPQTEETNQVQEAVSSREAFINEMVKQAEFQSYMKFGTRIKPVIEDEFREVILPNIAKVIEKMAKEFPEEDLSCLVITEKPGGGQSEKIFHIRNKTTNEDVLRFHVRRDHPPQAGYLFNFHYHTAHDQFQTHHELGVIYWDRNMPPKWMS